MRYLLLSICIALAGCASSNNKKTVSSDRVSPNWEWLSPESCPEAKFYGPQYCRDRTIVQIPNQPFEAQVRRARGEQW